MFADGAVSRTTVPTPPRFDKRGRQGLARGAASPSARNGNGRAAGVNCRGAIGVKETVRRVVIAESVFILSKLQNLHCRTGPAVGPVGDRQGMRSARTISVWRRTLWLTLLAAAAPTAWGRAPRQKTVILSPGLYVALPGVGIKIRPFRYFSNRPVPSVQTTEYQNRDTGQTVEAYEPEAIWRQDQTVALFQGEYGSITVGVMRYEVMDQLPLINQKHVLREVYLAARDKQEPAWNKDSITRWASTFAGVKVASATTKVRGMSMRYPYVSFSFADQPPEKMQAFLVTMPPADKRKRIFLLFNFNDKGKIRNAPVAAQSCVRSLSLSRTAGVEKGPDRKFQNRTAMRGAGDRSQEHKRTRQEVIENIRNLKDWWFVETPNYVICSNLTTRKRRTVDLIQDDIEIMRSAYETFMPPIAEVREVSVVRVFKSVEEYRDYIPEAMRWTGGVWMPSRKELVISPLAESRGKEARERILSVVYHEAFHQYLYYALGRMTPPVWYSEGHACFFEGSVISHRRKTVEVEEEESRLRRVLRTLDDNREFKISTLLGMSYDEFYGSQDMRAQYYAMSWGLAYFLRKAAPQYPKQNYARVHETTLAALIKAEGRIEPALAAGVAAVDADQLNRDFRDFWRSKTKRRRAAKNLLFKK